jgi:predicted RecA/RadA family phage recombinase
MQNFIRKGQILTWLNDSEAGVKGGDLLIIGNVVGVATLDIAPGASGAVAMEGVYQLPKASVAIAVGQRVYVDGDGTIPTTGAAGDTPAGVAWAAAGAGDSTAQVRINFCTWEIPDSGE